MTDPYTITDTCVDRLLREYHIHKRLIVALDFDDTVFDYHGTGDHYTSVLEIIRECQSLGFYIVLFTGSDKTQWSAQCEYLSKKGIVVDSINKNPITLPFGNYGKVYFNILLDDRSGLGQSIEILSRTVTAIKMGENSDNLS